MAFILASASPRRRELLAGLGVAFEVRPAKGAEHPAPGLSGAETAKQLSRAKCLEIAATAAPGDVIIAADTVVVARGEILGKPHDASDAARMLRALSGQSHWVYTGVTVVKDGTVFSEAEGTQVRFRALTDAEIDAYVSTGEPMDKAGAYGIQGRAALFVEGIDGDYFNVVGLPLCRLGEMLRQLGVSLI